MLHTVNKSPFNHGSLDECVRFAAKGAPILLIEDGVYAAKSGTAYEGSLKQIMQSHEVYALEADLKARGVAALADGVKVVNYDGFVELVEKHKMMAWV
ncbi:MAG: sulfurtransferase complex subunit TusB [Nitrospinae bacterium]|nr:sulfurtransferase complex subunit TusB [Nitrospinota bacterium]